MSNLFAMRADLSSPEMKQWQNEYLQVKDGKMENSRTVKISRMGNNQRNISRNKYGIVKHFDTEKL